MPRDVTSAAYDFRFPASDKASGKLESISVRESDNGGYIVTCYYQRGKGEEYVYEDRAGTEAYLLKQLKKLGKE